MKPLWRLVFALATGQAVSRLRIRIHQANLVIHSQQSLPAPVTLRLKPQRQYPFLARHPWVQAHALAEEGRDLHPGQVVDVADHDGNWVARGLLNPASRLRIRLYAFDSSVAVGNDLWQQRIDEAIQRRRFTHAAGPQQAERLVFSESDLISGLIVDRYADCLSVQFTSAALWHWQAAILERLHERFQPRAIKIRLDAKTAKLEGIEPIDCWHNDVPLSEPVCYEQNGLQLTVDLQAGQKTGGYLDQRLNHIAAAEYMRGRRVLDVCCYTGGFGLLAARAGAASVLGIDSSDAALRTATELAQRNGVETIEFRPGDCFDTLAGMVNDGQQFDAVILDPPRFAGSRHQVDAAIRAYTRLNSAAVDLLPPGGILVTCSCSGRVSRSDFLNMLMDVGRRRRRDLVVLQNRGPAPDHPVAISCPESNYLKCVIAEVR
jgi:23S rRNA (cytosine1962-C5)-methyltransferase